MSIIRGDMYYADLSPVVGSEQGGIRPVLIVQNDIGNNYSPTVIVAAITSRRNKSLLPTHIEISGLTRPSIVLLEQIRTIDASRLKDYIGHVDQMTMARVNHGLAISFELETPEPMMISM